MGERKVVLLQKMSNFKSLTARASRIFSFTAVTRYTRIPVSYHFQKKCAATHLLQKLWASREARPVLLRTFRLCAESPTAIRLRCCTEGPSYICKPKKPGPPSNSLDELAKSQADFWQKSFLWLIGSSLNGISERYFCFKELTASDTLENSQLLSHFLLNNYDSMTISSFRALLIFAPG